jgi:T-complex protein 1 subunit gamma
MHLCSSVGLHAKARSVTGVAGWPFRAVADAMEVIPRTLAQNAGGNAIRVLTELRAKHAGSVLGSGSNGATAASGSGAERHGGSHTDAKDNKEVRDSDAAKHSDVGASSWGIDGNTGKVVDMAEYGLWESASVKIQTLKTAIEAARVLLRVDDVVQAKKQERNGGDGGGGGGMAPEAE